MQSIVAECHNANVICKVIFETCYLSKDEIITLANIAKKIKPDYIKTSTGFGSGGAETEIVRLMKETVGNELKVKAAGGIRTLEDALAMIEAGAERIGTSAGVTIIESFTL